MIYAYIRISTNRQSSETQRFEILNFMDEKKMVIDEWVEEIVSGTKSASERSLGDMMNKVKKGDTVIVTELSRLGRRLMDVMATLNLCINQGITVHSIKEKFTLADDINTKVLAFAFSLSAEIERQLISQRTKEALARKKSEGYKLGRPTGSRNKTTKLTGKEEEISLYKEKQISTATLARIYGVNRLTMIKFIKSLPSKPQITAHKKVIVKEGKVYKNV